MGIRPIALLLFLALGAPPAIAGEAVPSLCSRAFAWLIDKPKQGWEGTKAYAREVRDSRGLRILVRPVTPEEIAAEELHLLFWKKRPPGEVPYRARAYRALQRWFGKENPPISEDKRYLRFSPRAPFTAVIQWPIRATTRHLVRHKLLEREFRFTAPVVTGIFLFTYDPVFYPIEKGIEAYEAHEKKKELSALRTENFYYDRELSRLESDLDELIREAERNFQEKSRNLRSRANSPAYRKLHELREKRAELPMRYYEALQAEHAAYAEQNSIFNQRYQSAQTEEERLALERERALLLWESPLFSDLAEATGLSVSELEIDPEKFALAEALITQRQRLFLRYSLIPQILVGKEKRLELLANPGYREETRDVLVSPLYKELRKAFARKQITQAQFQKALMEDSFWKLDRFGMWRILGAVPPPQFSEDGQPKPGTVLSLHDIRQEILSSLEIEAGHNNSR